jgi:protein-L-isoaspartate(D-aspartate) O-methyltransferase
MKRMENDPNLNERRQMVEQQIRRRGINDSRILEAMEQVPREDFIPGNRAPSAFSDQALSIDCGQTISQPYMVASMTDLLNISSTDRVLEIGTGSGYQAAILSQVAQHVYTIDRHEQLVETARQRLEELEIQNVSFKVGDGSKGWPEEAPFDRILVTAAAPEVPKPLVNQLVDGGRMVIPVGSAMEQTLTIVERIGDRTREIPRFPCRFVKFIGSEAWPSE